MISSATWIFFLKIKTHVNLEISSIMTRMYFFPYPDLTRTSPNRSLWRRWRGLTINEQDFGLKEDLVCLPFSHVKHNLSLTNCTLGIPLTNWFLAIFKMFLKFICDILLSKDNIDEIEHEKRSNDEESFQQKTYLNHRCCFVDLQ